ncbi:M14 family metallopeptidase [Amycolatopsis sp. CA-230715]|uniref:M14 family metallopeptidase n=1 Tax=Amycolatopsis sp. CA-230715 TaxID=2745196 RepID=UPI001C01DE35|nr:M14 family metallopeptidase [Amycolatopsis sp. CA-230715]QWF80417.1 Zinc carboxypeptidase [Amycolatopsis sp. CA-230715]
MFTRRRTWGALAAAAGLALLTATAPAHGEPAAPDRGLYEVHGATDAAKRTTVRNSGADVAGTRGDVMTVVATPKQADGLRAGGFALDQVGDFDQLLAQRSSKGGAYKPGDFPPGDEAYHTYAETTDALKKAVADHGDLAQLSSAGKSFEGRELNVLKIASKASEGKPEVLFTCNQHAREHLTTEMCLHIVQRFTDGYAKDAAIKGMVDSHQIYVVPNVNPDGSEYDISGGKYQGWRKTRKPVPNSNEIGTDPNRNWGYKWGCCGGSSDDPSAEDYHGPSAFSEPETKAVSDFMAGHQFKAHIDFHTFSELVLWPYGYTKDDTAEGMSAEEAKRFADVGKQMADTNKYTPEQSSDLYVTDGDINDWAWSKSKTLSYTFEMYPKDGGIDGFYPPASEIPEQTTRNDAAVDILLKQAG